MYAGDQAGGNMVQWPNVEGCFDNGWTPERAHLENQQLPFDARLRPWYTYWG